MKKGFKFYAIFWLILVAMFNLICFTVPSLIDGYVKYDAAFLTGYVFIMLTFIGNLACAYVAFSEKNLQKLFYNIPIVKISYSALIASIIVGALVMAIPGVPSWLGIIVCALILGFNIISVIKASVASDIVGEIDDKVKTQTFFIKSLTVDAGTLVSLAKSDEIRAEANKVYEAARYADPMSNDMLKGIELQIMEAFNKLGDAVKADNLEQVKTLANEVVVLVGDRNRKCKLLK